MKRILCIDDESDLLRCFKDALQSQGYDVATADDPDAGIDILRDDPAFDLLTLDIKMPIKDGFEVYQEIRKFSDVPVLFVTAYPRSFTTESDDVVRMWEEQFSAGDTDIMYKPFELDVFFNKIEGLIGSANDEGTD
ncbi:MAG: response regulator [Verrucomicrobia bacterium]|nr:response regulator [Verrucomicrobiota bacterium]